jgi:hypothetical protein
MNEIHDFFAIKDDVKKDIQREAISYPMSVWRCGGVKEAMIGYTIGS